MQRKFLTNLGLLLFLNLLIKPIWIFGIDLTVQRNVGVGDYGFYFVILNFSFLFNIILDFGITNFNNRNIAQHNHLLNKHFSGILVLKLLLGLAFVLVAFVIAMVLRYSAAQFWLLGWLALNQFLLPRKLQKQAYDHVLRATETNGDAFAAVIYYVCENPVRARLAGTALEWPYSGACVPDVPTLDPRQADFHELWWPYWNSHQK